MSKISFSPKQLPVYLLPLLSGIALIAAFPPFEQGYLAWLAPAPFIWFCLSVEPRRAFRGGFLFGIPLHLYLNLYLSGVLLDYLSTALAVIALAGLVLISSLSNALFAVSASYLARHRQGAGLVLLFPSLWIIFEYARSLSFLGYTVGYLGYTQWRYVEILNLAAVYGYWGLPFVMVALQSYIVLLLAGRLTIKQSPATALVLLLLISAGLFLPGLLSVEREETPLWTALVQGNSAPEEILAPAGKEVILERHLELTRQALEEEPRISLVVWPETVVDLNLTGDRPQRPEMVRLARELNISILFGARVRVGEQLFNSIVLLSPGSDEFTTVYHKQRLVPFVEYFPLEELLNKALDLDVLLGSYRPGKELVVFDLSGIPLAGVICFESYFGDYTRLFAKEGARHLFVITNNAWFDGTIGLEQHAHVSAIRAAEMGIGTTQVANSGITLSFDYRGREVFRAAKAERNVFVVPLDLARRNTFYTAAGDYFPAFWACFAAGHLLYPFVSARRKARNL